ncbi:hypothetical protein Vadar_025963 [Vaccinium darrowii]|uniref:Uncharacterized protein n=1 Tax=Vaccinium darrowii TaxID=229202 RepID=A0ACB7X3S4_9ERIC|nr:hypothetical protein Vadar_025963 [Vaccinium darrowii]
MTGRKRGSPMFSSTWTYRCILRARHGPEEIEIPIATMDRRLRTRKTKNGKQKRLEIRTSIEDLPPDVSFNILKQLPITSLLSFKLASKACYNMTTNPLLTPKYQHHRDNPNCLITVPLFLEEQRVDHLYIINNHKHNGHKENEIRDVKFLESINQSMIDKGFVFNTILSSNGLLCLLFCKTNGSDYRVCLYNPLTSEHHFLPDPKLARAGNPTQTTIDAVTTNQFFRGETGIRRSRINNLFHVPENSSDVVVGGAIHWLCNWKEIIMILSFDLLKENWVMNEKPDFVMGTDYILSVFGGCLALTVPDRDHFDIWMMKKNGVRKSWTLEFVIRKFPLPGAGMIYPLFVLSSGSILVAHKNAEICVYDPESKAFLGMYIPGLVPEYFKAICYTPSLVSPVF